MTSDDSFNVLAPPPPPPAPAFAAAGSQFAPKTGPANQPVTLNGTNFDQPGLAVTLGGTACALNGVATATQIPIKIPAAPAGVRTFTVTTAGGSVTSSDVSR
ncbi:MAG: IPT/TIG domain-containing protein [Ignavibacteriota bacterium]